MPSLRPDWHERIKAVRTGVTRLKVAVTADPTLLEAGSKPAHPNDAVRNLEGTYLVRLFAEFESALRPHDRARLQLFLSWLPEEWG